MVKALKRWFAGVLWIFWYGENVVERQLLSKENKMQRAEWKEFIAVVLLTILGFIGTIGLVGFTIAVGKAIRTKPAIADDAPRDLFQEYGINFEPKPPHRIYYDQVGDELFCDLKPCTLEAIKRFFKDWPEDVKHLAEPERLKPVEEE